MIRYFRTWKGFDSWLARRFFRDDLFFCVEPRFFLCDDPRSFTCFRFCSCPFLLFAIYFSPLCFRGGQSRLFASFGLGSLFSFCFHSCLFFVGSHASLFTSFRLGPLRGFNFRFQACRLAHLRVGQCFFFGPAFCIRFRCEFFGGDSSLLCQPCIFSGLNFSPALFFGLCCVAGVVTSFGLSPRFFVGKPRFIGESFDFRARHLFSKLSSPIPSIQTP